jgi:hypothetical protein
MEQLLETPKTQFERSFQKCQKWWDKYACA